MNTIQVLYSHSNPYTYIPIYLYASNLSVRVSLQVSPPLFVEELMEDHHHDKVLSNLVREFDAHHGTRENFSFDHH